MASYLIPTDRLAEFSFLMLMQKTKEKVVVGVCTCRRPGLLARCLASLTSLPMSEAFDVDIIVIENDDAPRNKSTVLSAKDSSSHPLHYYYESALGIPFARNRFVEEALLLSADWLVFIDDDETAEPDWLNQLYNAAHQLNADVIQGRTIYHYPAEDKWAKLLDKNEKQRLRPDKNAMKTAATNNVIFSSRLVASGGLNLRFDTGLRFSGGSDSDFFNRAHLKGARFYYAALAIVHEVVPLERCTLAYLFERNARNRAAAFYMDQKNLGRIQAVRKHLRRLLQSILQGIGYLLRSLFWLLTDRYKSRELYLRGVLKLASCHGSLLGLCGKLLAPYKNIQGH